MKTETVLALGSNLGDRARNLDAAITKITDVVSIRGRSRRYETAPQYVENQPAFLNMAIIGETELAALDLLETVKNIEDELGRVPSERFGPRLIDIDVIFYGDTIMDTPRLTLPHPRYSERAFVLQPILDICPGWPHPLTGKTAKQLIEALPESNDVVLFD